MARHATSMAEIQKDREARAAMEEDVVADTKDWIKGLDERIEYASGEGRTNIIIAMNDDEQNQLLADKLMWHYRDLGYSTSWTNIQSALAVPLSHGLIPVDEVVLTIQWGGYA